MIRADKIFSFLLKLYPLPFQSRFAAEMQEVFQEGMAQATRQGSVNQYLLHELLRTPGNLVATYAWSVRAEKTERAVVSGSGGSGTAGIQLPGDGWGASILAGLPHLLIFAVILLSLVFETQAMQGSLRIIAVILFSLLILAVCIFSLIKGWKHWLVSWASYLTLIILAALSSGITALASQREADLQNVSALLTTLLPLSFAYVIYRITRTDRLRGLLATIPVMVLSWMYFSESVPFLPKTLSWAWAFLLAFVATLLMLRTRFFIIALGLALAVPVLAGFPLAYIGVYLGGTLPFTAPGPSLIEVLKQYLPFLCMTSTILLAPQLAVKLRNMCLELAGTRYKLLHRLTLGGLLLAILLAVLQWNRALNGDHLGVAVQLLLLVAAIVLYITGFILLLRQVARQKLLIHDPGLLVHLVAVFLLLMCVPAAMLLPLLVTQANALLSWLIIAVGIEWAFACAWLVKD